MSNVDKFGCWYKTKDRPVWHGQQQQKEKQGENSKYVYLCKGKEHKHTHASHVSIVYPRVKISDRCVIIVVR